MGSDIASKLMSTAMNANEVFNKLHEESVTTVGISHQTAGFITVVVDCALSGGRIALLIKEEKPDIVVIAIGQRSSNDLKEVREYDFDNFGPGIVLEAMQGYFMKAPDSRM